MKTLTETQITEAGFSEDQFNHIKALCAHLDCDPDDLRERDYDHYGLPVYSMGSRDFAIGDDDEATKAAVAYIRDSAWAFKASFICSECNLPSELEEAIEAWQSRECESCNEAIVSMIESHCGMEGSHSFSESAIRADGRGHFLSPYDGEENEESVPDTEELEGGTFYIYRLN